MNRRMVVEYDPADPTGVRRICKGCKKSFDPNDFGTLRVYCKPMCKYTEGGTKVMHRKPGRPRRWMGLEEAQRVLIHEDLATRGWIVRPTVRDGIVSVRRGPWCLNVALGSLGGTQKLEMYAHAVAQIRCNRITYESSCNRKREWVHDHRRKDGKMRLKRAPCGQCRRCISAQWLNTSGKDSGAQFSMPPEVEEQLRFLAQRRAAERRREAWATGNQGRKVPKSVEQLAHEEVDSKGVAE